MYVLTYWSDREECNVMGVYNTMDDLFKSVEGLPVNTQKKFINDIHDFYVTKAEPNQEPAFQKEFQHWQSATDMGQCLRYTDEFNIFKAKVNNYIFCNHCGTHISLPQHMLYAKHYCSPSCVEGKLELMRRVTNKTLGL